MCFPRSEFEKAGLTPVPAATVKHPRIAEAAACLECKLYRLIEISGTRERFNLPGKLP